MVFSLEKAPHLVGKRTTKGIMLELSAVLMVVFLYSMTWYFVRVGGEYGLKAILILIVSLASSVGADALFALSLLFDKKVSSVKERFMAFGKKILLSYGYVSGLIFALLVPIGTPYYVVFVGSFVGTLLAKDIFGGFGTNIFNPAIVGRVFVQVCFPSQLVSYLGAAAPDTVSTGATIMSTTSALGWTTNFNEISLLDLSLGNYRGTLGEPFALLLILAGIYLIVRKIIDWRFPVFYLGSLALIALSMGLCSGLGIHSFEFTVRSLFIGGALFGGIFCLTDPVTAPTSKAGKCIYAVSAALLTALIRYQANAVEGVAYAILLVNMLAPLMTKFLKAKSDQKLVLKSSVIGGIAAIGIVFGCVYGVNNKTGDVYSDQVARYDEDINVYNLVIRTAEKSASNYLEVPATMDSALGTINKKVNFTMDDEPASYYELSTNPALSFKQPTGDDTTEYYVTFGIIINAKGTVGYQYYSGNEDAGGTQFAKELLMTPENPYIKDELTSANVNSDLIPTGASSPVASTKTVPAILTAIKGAEAEADFGLDLEEGGITFNLNKILKVQNIPALKESDVTVESNPIMPDASKVGVCTLKLDGFKINSEDATYYEITTPTKVLNTEYGDEDVTVTLGVLINADGVVGFKGINLTVGTGISDVKTLETTITISNPFTLTDTVGGSLGFGDIIFTGASEYTSNIIDAVLKSCLSEFQGGN